MRNLKDDIRDGLSELGETVRRLRGTSDDTLLAALEAFEVYAIAQGNLTIRITETPQVSQPNALAGGETTVVGLNQVDAHGVKDTVPTGTAGIQCHVATHCTSSARVSGPVRFAKVPRQRSPS